MPDGWNYRILRHRKDEGEFYALHEVYYEGGEPTGCSKEPVLHKWYEEPGDIGTDLQKMQEALDKPVLNYSDFE